MAKPVEAPLGGFGADEHDRLVKWFSSVVLQLQTGCSNLYREMVYHESLALGQRRDPRKKHEMWRSNLHIPYAASAIETAVSAELDIMLATSPWIQAEGIGDEDQQGARAIERLLQHTLTVNAWPTNLGAALQNKRVRGTHIWKVTNRPRYSRVWIDVSQSDMDDWQKRVQELSQMSGIPAPDPSNPDESFPGENKMLFEAWRDMVSKAGLGYVPDQPTTGWKNVVQRTAPDISAQSPYEVLMDPRVYDVQDQPFIIQRTKKTARWVMDRVDNGDGRGIFHKAQVERGISGTADATIATWDQQTGEMLGIQGYTSRLWENYNADDQPVEILECWRRNDEFPYVVILNRTTIINLRPEQMPYKHGMYPYVMLRNKPRPDMAFGTSDLKQTSSMYEHIDKMYNLHMDALLLSVIPVWLATKNAGLPADMGGAFSPGKVWSVSMLDAIKPLMKDHPHPDMWRIIADLKGNIDETQSTTAPVRGGAVTLNRVSATQSERAFSQSLLRQKSAAIMTETELRPLVHQVLSLLRDHVSSDDRINSVGRDLGLDVLKNVPRELLVKALDQDYAFHGATSAVNRAERMGFFREFFQTANGSQLLAPQEARALLAMWWRESNIPGVGSVITEAGNRAVVNQLQMEQARQQAAAMAPDQSAQPGLVDEGHDSGDPNIVPGTASDLAGVGTTTQTF